MTTSQPQPNPQPLFSPSIPIADGFYWWRADESDTSPPEPIEFFYRDDPKDSRFGRFGDGYSKEPYGLFGPQIPLPIAQPVYNTGCFIEDGSICEGVFIPTRRTMVPC